MASWYDKAVFYHIYPLGMLGAPFVNTRFVQIQDVDVIVKKCKFHSDILL